MNFLSPEWFDALNAALSSVAPLVAPESRLGIGQLVTGAQDGDVSYTVFVGGHRPASVTTGSTDEAQVTIETDYKTAAAIAAGGSTAEFLYAGRLKVRGDAAVLLEAQEAFSALSGVLESLAATTQF